MARNRSQRASQRRSSQAGDSARIQVDSGDEYEGTQRPLSRDGTSSIPDGGFSALAEEQQDELVKRMIRLMICRNAMKKPVKREDLSKHIFANMGNIRSKGKVFQGTFTAAQQKLRTIFGMEMVLIQRQVKVKRSGSSRMASQATQSGPVGTKGYVLISVLDHETRAEERKNRASFGFLMVVAGMILMEPSCRIEQEDLYSALRRLGVHVRESKGHKQLNGGNVKELLESVLVKQWYLEREKEGDTFFYTLGPRFRVEIEGDDVVGFVDAVYKLTDEKNALDEMTKNELKKRFDDAFGIGQRDVEMEMEEEEED